MPKQARRLHNFIFRHWAGQLLSAALLPGWLLLLAASNHGVRPVASLAGLILAGIALLAGLLVIGVWLWSRDRPGALEQQIKAWTTPVQTASESSLNFWSLLGGAAFFAAGAQVLIDFNLFSRLFTDLGVGQLSGWGSLLGLSAIQFICFFARNRWLNRA